METKSKRNLTAPKTRLPGTVFENNFRLPEEDSQARYDSRTSSELRNRNKNDIVHNDKSKKYFAEAKTDDNEDEFKQVEREEIMPLSSSRSSEKNLSSNGRSNDHAQSERTPVQGDGLALRSYPGKQNKGTINNNLTHDWELQENDLLCIPLVINKTRVKDYMDINYDRPQVPLKRNQPRKGKKVSATRLGIASYVHSLAIYEKLIDQMRATLENKGLVPCDVCLDGNCLFAALVDQLRVRGDFSFTAHTLRQAAVNYLIKNPITSDGTALEMFLTDGEIWENYLLRMSKDGEWGDHIVIGALANAIQMQIIIYGGETGERETVVYPDNMNDFRSHKFEQSQENVVHLGHVSESHYISLRPKHWRQNLDKGVQKDELTSRSQLSESRRTKCPILHLNVILKQTFRLELIKSFRSDHVDVFAPSLHHGCDDIVEEIFGSLICKLVPCKTKYTTTTTNNIGMFLPPVKAEDESDENSNNAFHTLFLTPLDTAIVSANADAKVTDLVTEEDMMTTGHLKLIPKSPKIWREQTVSMKGKTYIKTFEVNFDLLDDSRPEKVSKYLLDLHHVLAFHCPWPDVAKNWAHRYRKSRFPDEHIVKNGVSNGCHVIPMMLDARMSNLLDDSIQFMTLEDECTWCYTFAAAEKEICRFLSSEQRQSFLIFKSFVDITLQGISLPASVAKNIFYYALENIQRETWKVKPCECFLLLLKKTIECFRNGQVPHYFMPEKNLLRFIPGDVIHDSLIRLEHASQRPVVHLYFLLDHLNVFPSGIGRFVEEILETIEEDLPTGTEVSIARQTLHQASTELLNDLLLHENYKAAMLVFQDMVKEKGMSLETNGFYILNEILWNSDIETGYYWCLAFYVDKVRKSTLLEQLCYGILTIPVTEVFGPECIYELPNTLVPDFFCIMNGNLPFAAMVFRVLYQVVSKEMFVKCIKYYLKMYGKLAGDSLILADRDLVGGNNKATTENQHAVTSTSYLRILSTMYVDLYNLCLSDMIEEFHEMMPTYTLIAESLSDQVSLRNITVMTTALDGSKILTSALRKAGYGKGKNKTFKLK